ncbi:DNA repair exonuclease [Desulfobaculum senezii]
MLTFIHAADIHLDSPLKGLERYDGAPVDDVRGASRRALTSLVDIIIDDNIPLLVLAGDVYDGDWKDFQTGLFFASQMTRLREAGTHVVLIRGNHDAQNKMTRSLTLPANVHVLSANRPETVRFDDIGVAVHGQSFAGATVTENLAASYPPPVPGLYNIGLLHTAVAGVDGHANYAPCSQTDLAAHGYDYWALGHVHDHKVLVETPPVIYSGVLQGRNIRETGPKGCVRVDVDDSGHTAYRFMPLDVMRFARVAVDAADAPDTAAICDRFLAAMERHLAEAEGRPLAMRIHLSGPCAAHSALAADPEAAQNLLRTAATDASGGSAWVEKVIDETTTPIDIDALRDSDTPQGDLVRFLDELEVSGEAFAELGIDFKDLRAALSRSGAADITLPDLDDPAQRAALLRDVRELVLPRISGAGEAS